MDIQASPNPLDLTNSPAEAIRCIRNGGFAPSELRTWINTCLANGLWPIPCFGHEGYTNDAAGRQAYARAIHDVFAVGGGVTEGGIYCEMANEPGAGDGSNTDAEKLANRDNYLKMLFTPVNVYGSTMSAVDVVHSFGMKVCLAAITDKTGQFVSMRADINNHSQGSDWDDIDAIAFHPYAQEPNDVVQTLVANRAQVDLSDGARGKPLLVTEVGWCCAVRADGTNPGSPDDWNNDDPSWLNVDRIITRADQADKIDKSNSTGLWERIALPGIVDSGPGGCALLLLLALCWFGHQDYGLPDRNGYNHCGLFDFGGITDPHKRTAWGRLNAFKRRLRYDHYHKP